ncbi:MAG TPA: chemotaxis protein CheC [Solirubrobacteraceae bacterium]|nr:chemotaxis protein CheC [Solirubrobacteraceae bacterium]
MSSTFSAMQLDALGELANIGSGTAATALSGMIGQPVDVSVPNAMALPLADAVDAAGPAEQQVTAVALPVLGDLEGIVLMLFAGQSAETLCSILGVEAGTEMGFSALSEIGNIVGASYLGALGTTTGVNIEPGPPQAASDMLGAVVSSILAASAETADIALLLDSNLIIEGTDAQVSFLLVPSTKSVNDLLQRLGIS